jgi:hypothetical protein
MLVYESLLLQYMTYILYAKMDDLQD